MAAEKTAANTGMLFNIALNYGGRAEIVEACAARCVGRGRRGSRRAALRGFLYTAGSRIPTC
jgi:hypothetical protein